VADNDKHADYIMKIRMNRFLVLFLRANGTRGFEKIPQFIKK
jgi:hypothetical protein